MSPTSITSAAGCFPCNTHTVRLPLPLSLLTILACLGCDGGRVIRLSMNPPEGAEADGLGGVKRSAALGTSSTPSRLAVEISAVAVMPGRRLRSPLETFSSVL